jgi:hypothetical protein
MSIVISKCCHQCWCFHQCQRGRLLDSWLGQLVVSDVNPWGVILEIEIDVNPWRCLVAISGIPIGGVKEPEFDSRIWT